MTDTPVVTGILVIVFIGLVLLIRMRKAVGTALSSAAMGLAAMGAVNLTGLLTGVTLPWNLFTLLVCTILGAPGVVSMLVLQLFW
jgi:pro-sigmaK processing inhibitor BofA